MNNASRLNKLRTIRTPVPGQNAIELTAYYPQFEAYFADCEMQTKLWCVQNINPDWVVFDIGANVGYYSVLFSRLTPQGVVHAFEPTQTADMLDENLAHNHCTNVQVHRTAIGRTSGTIQDKIFRIWGEEADNAVFPFITLDDFVEQNKIQRIDCIKIDVDSYEVDVLEGAQKTLERFNPAVICEFNNTALQQRQSSIAALADWFVQHGYRQGFVMDKENVLLKRSPLAPNDIPKLKFIRDNAQVAIDDKANQFYEISDEIPLQQFETVTCPQSGARAGIIETMPEPNSAALSIHFAAPNHTKKSWIVEMEVEVLKGQIFVGIANSKNTYISTRRHILACPQTQIIHLLINEVDAQPEARYQCVAVNSDTSGQSSHFRVVQLRAFNLQ